MTGVTKKCLSPTHGLFLSAERFPDCKSAMIGLRKAIKEHTGTFKTFNFQATLTKELPKFAEEGSKICEDEFAKLQDRKA